MSVDQEKRTQVLTLGYADDVTLESNCPSSGCPSSGCPSSPSPRSLALAVTRSGTVKLVGASLSSLPSFSLDQQQSASNSSSN